MGKNPVEPTVLIEGQPAAIAGPSVDGDSPATPSGEPTVLMAGHPAAILDGPTAGEHRPVSGMPTVLVAGRPAADDCT